MGEDGSADGGHGWIGLAQDSSLMTVTGVKFMALPAASGFERSACEGATVKQMSDARSTHHHVLHQNNRT